MEKHGVIFRFEFTFWDAEPVPREEWVMLVVNRAA
jgi:hypothetical protein